MFLGREEQMIGKLDLQNIMDRDKWCMYPLHLRHIKVNGSSQKGKLVERSRKMNKVQRHEKDRADSELLCIAEARNADN